MFKKWFVGAIVLITISLQGVVAFSATPFVAKPATVETVKQMQAGGLVLYMRHGPTNTAIPDRVPRVDLNDCSTQRPLTEEGRAVAVKVGEAIRQAGIPVDEIRVSPMCRTKQTAKAAFGTDIRLIKNLMYTSNLTSKQKEPRIEYLRQTLSTPVKAGTNLILVSHAPNMMDTMGYFVKPEAAVVVIRPLGEKGFEYLGTIEPQEWQGLLQQLLH